MATGTGKTVVMAMLIAWHTLNKLANARDDRFGDAFVVVTPGITIRDRLRVLLPSDPDNYYEGFQAAGRSLAGIPIGRVQEENSRMKRTSPGEHQNNERVPDAGLIPVYEQLCQSYRAIDDFRLKLLGLLPLATGTGVLLLLNGKISFDSTTAELVKTQQFLGAIGGFGFIVTLGFFFYELHGMKKCGRLISAGKDIEKRLHVLGQFANRPHEVAGIIDEPFTASVIYPASLGAWVFLGLVFISRLLALVAASAVLLFGVVGSFLLNRRIDHDLDEGLEYANEPSVDRLTLDKEWKLLVRTDSDKAKAIFAYLGHKNLRARLDAPSTPVDSTLGVSIGVEVQRASWDKARSAFKEWRSEEDRRRDNESA